MFAFSNLFFVFFHLFFFVFLNISIFNLSCFKFSNFNTFLRLVRRLETRNRRFNRIEFLQKENRR